MDVYSFLLRDICFVSLRDIYFVIFGCADTNGLNIARSANIGVANYRRRKISIFRL